MTDMPLPSNIEAERAVLGSVLLNREAILAVSGWLEADDFYAEQHAWIFGAMLACVANRVPPDTRTVSDELRKKGRLETIGGLPYLLALVDAVPSSYHIEYYAQIVQRTAIFRRIVGIGGRIAAKGYHEDKDPDAVLAELHAMIDTAAKNYTSTSWQPFTLEQLFKEEIPPIRWVVQDLIPEGVSLLVGGPKMKKSWMAYGIGLAVAAGGRALGEYPVEAGEVLYAALEDGKRRLKARGELMLQGGPAVPGFWMVTDMPRLNAGGLGRIESWLQAHPAARLVIIDVLEKVRPARAGNGNGYGEDYEAIGPLKKLAEAHGVGILVLHHKRKAEAEDVMDTVSGTAGITGAVDSVLILQYERGAQDAVLHRTGRDLPDDSALALQWHGATYQWVVLGKAEEYQKSKERSEIIDVIRGEGRDVGPKDVADALGKPYQNIKQLMRRMVLDGDLVNMGRGQYNIPERAPGRPSEAEDDPQAAAPGGSAVINRDHFDHFDHPDHFDPLDHLGKGPEGDQVIEGDPTTITEVLGITTRELPKVIEVIAHIPDRRLDWGYLIGRFRSDDLQAIGLHCSIKRVDVDAVLQALRGLLSIVPADPAELADQGADHG